jgi:hypothetical protein
LAEPEGSWAIASDKIAASPKQTTPTKHHSGLWEGIKNLPLTATLGPLIGLIGLGFLILFLVSLTKRKNAKAAVS